MRPAETGSLLQPFLDVNKRTGRLACNIPLLKNRLAPLSFLEMDKEKYVEGLLAFYELNRIDLLKSAYIQGYVDSASRYDAYVGRERSAVELEVRRRADIHTYVKSFVEKSVSQGRRVDADAYAREYFRAEPQDLQSKLVERVGEIIAALNDANHMAFRKRCSATTSGYRFPEKHKSRGAASCSISCRTSPANDFLVDSVDPSA